ncbi:MAG: HAD family hydrolase [Planctomycetota bacterium]|jgi:putative hydrolase of the HAD superfamily
MQAIIFDLDDTLILERDYALSGFAAVASAHADLLGEPARVEPFLTECFDHGDRRRIFNEALVRAGQPVDSELIALMVATYRGHKPTISLLPDARRAIERLRPTCKLGIITDGFEQAQANKIEATGVDRLVDEVVITARLGDGFSKPAPRAFEWIAQRLDTHPHACTYVADNPAKDFIAPNALGWRTIRIVRAEGVYRDTPVAPGGDPQLVIDTLDDVKLA